MTPLRINTCNVGLSVDGKKIEVKTPWKQKVLRESDAL